MKSLPLPSRCIPGKARQRERGGLPVHLWGYLKGMTSIPVLSQHKPRSPPRPPRRFHRAGKPRAACPTPAPHSLCQAPSSAPDVLRPLLAGQRPVQQYLLRGHGAAGPGRSGAHPGPTRHDRRHRPVPGRMGRRRHVLAHRGRAQGLDMGWTRKKASRAAILHLLTSARSNSRGQQWLPLLAKER